MHLTAGSREYNFFWYFLHWLFISRYLHLKLDIIYLKLNVNCLKIELYLD